MDLELLSFLISGLAFVGAWLIVQPQRVENDALHQSIDNNTNALRELTGLINEMRIEQGKVDQQLDGLWHRYKEVKEELEELRKCCHCGGKGGE